jgi:peptide/nickel transport system ATP-binding protein
MSEALARPQAGPRTPAALAPEERLRVTDLRTHFVRGHSVAKAVDGVSFAVRSGETLAIVGESGSGKSVTSLSIMGLLARAGRIAGGSMLYRCRDGAAVDLALASVRQRRALRGAEIAMIFQEPMTSLNPLFTVGDQIGEMVRLHEPVSRATARERARRALELVEIPAAVTRLDEYPHQMSGGMRQRVMIAMALVCNPALLIADEPTTALDVTVQAQILDLLRRLQVELGMSILFITHNLGVVAEIAHRAVVMYAGRVVEDAPVAALFRQQKHPYTRGLLACMPDVERDRDAVSGRRLRLSPIPGAVPSIHSLPPGCSFAPRCALAEPACEAEPPALVAVAPDHLSRCRRHTEL